MSKGLQESSSMEDLRLFCNISVMMQLQSWIMIGMIGMIGMIVGKKQQEPNESKNAPSLCDNEQFDFLDIQIYHEKKKASLV